MPEIELSIKNLFHAAAETLDAIDRVERQTGWSWPFQAGWDQVNFTDARRNLVQAYRASYNEFRQSVCLMEPASKGRRDWETKGVRSLSAALKQMSNVISPVLSELGEGEEADNLRYVISVGNSLLDPDRKIQPAGQNPISGIAPPEAFFEPPNLH